MRAAVWITLLTVLIGTLSVEGRSSKRKLLKTSGQFVVKEKQPLEGSNRHARQSTNCIITGKNGQPSRTFGKPTPPQGSPTCIIIAPPAVTSPTTTTTPGITPAEPPPPVITPAEPPPLGSPPPG